MKKKTLTKAGKTIYNKGVEAACKEILKWDGAVPDADLRNHMARTIQNDVSYKRKKKKKEADE